MSEREIVNVKDNWNSMEYLCPLAIKLWGCSPLRSDVLEFQRRVEFLNLLIPLFLQFLHIESELLSHGLNSASG